MKNRQYQIKKFILLIWVCSIVLMGCGTKEQEKQRFLCHVVLEDGEGFETENSHCEIEPGEDVVFTLQMKEGYTLEAVDYPDSTIAYSDKGDSMTLTLHKVNYSKVVSVITKRSDLEISYDANGGQRIYVDEAFYGDEAFHGDKTFYGDEALHGDERIEGEDSSVSVSIATISSHLRVNTSIGTDLFVRKGYTLTGWNTSIDGSGTHVGLGSRVPVTEEILLYAEWVKWSQASYFSYEVFQNQAIITGYTGQDRILAIPAELDSYPVISIEDGAFANTSCETVIFPVTLQTVETGAFRNSSMKELYLYDNISSINDYVFEDCENLTTLHINAVEKPVYSGTYFDTFQDKYDRLLDEKEEQKIVLFSGSATRFGYDSARIEEAFEKYSVVNMGVFAYSNAAPQLMLILDAMNASDILLDSPEFDAAKRQFCTNYDIDDAFFCMMESNYDTFAELDLRMFQKTFSALYSYLSTKSGMTEKSYTLSPSDFTEDGAETKMESYNEYGDYILYRPNSTDDAPVYGLPVDYTVAAFPKELYIDSINEMYTRFLNKGIDVYFTYAPRNQYAISKESTLQARAELDAYLREELIVPVISNIEESFYLGTYLYGTDNHLSTEGVANRTTLILNDLKLQMEKEGTINE